MQCQFLLERLRRKLRRHLRRLSNLRGQPVPRRVRGVVPGHVHNLPRLPVRQLPLRMRAELARRLRRVLDMVSERPVPQWVPGILRRNLRPVRILRSWAVPERLRPDLCRRLHELPCVRRRILPLGMRSVLGGRLRAVHGVSQWTVLGWMWGFFGRSVQSVLVSVHCPKLRGWVRRGRERHLPAVRVRVLGWGVRGRMRGGIPGRLCPVLRRVPGRTVRAAMWGDFAWNLRGLCDSLWRWKVCRKLRGGFERELRSVLHGSILVRQWSVPPRMRRQVARQLPSVLSRVRRRAVCVWMRGAVERLLFSMLCRLPCRRVCKRVRGAAEWHLQLLLHRVLCRFVRAGLRRNLQRHM
jgi:hypothetical protein